MSKLGVILLTSAVFALCESSAIIKKINKKCGISDNECLKSVYRSMLEEVSDNGIPDLDIPKADPFVIKEREIVAFGMIKLTFTDAIAKGFKNCHCTSFKNDIEKQHYSVDFLCEHFSVEGNYKVESTPTLLALIGGINIHGEGKGGVVIEKVMLNFDFAYEIKKFEDSELHFVAKPDESSYTFEVLDKVTASADNLFVGKQEISTVAVNIINENWEFVSKSVGNLVADIALEHFYADIQKFFNAVPIKDLITDDLTPYVKS